MISRSRLFLNWASLTTQIAPKGPGRHSRPTWDRRQNRSYPDDPDVPGLDQPPLRPEVEALGPDVEGKPFVGLGTSIT